MGEELAGDGSVVVDLGDGLWSAHWPDTGTRAGPFSAGASGRWETARGRAAGRDGRWARWVPASFGPWTAIHVPDAGPVIVVEAGVVAADDGLIDEIAVASGPLHVGGAGGPIVRLVDGYEAMSYSGVRAAATPGSSYWNTAFVRAGGAAFAVQALTARRLCTRIASRVSSGDLIVTVAAGGTPPLVSLPNTFAYELGEPAPLRRPCARGEEVRAELVAMAAGTDALVLVEELAAMAGRESGARQWAGPPALGWETWYHYGLLAVDPEIVLANARTLRERYADRPGFDLVQIDDGWQRTYGDWRPNERFPDELGELVDALHGLGCRAGLWVAPFMVQPGAAPVGVEHPGWLVRDGDGAPLADRHGRFGLDGSHPDAVAWLHDLGATVRRWGFDMVKLDFLYIGAMEGGRHDPRMAGIESMRAGLAAVVDGLGPSVYVLTCLAPVLPVVGLAHANRVGNDLALPRLLRGFGDQPLPGWTGFDGVRPQARNLAARYAGHGHWFAADPDVVMAWGSDGRDPDGFSVEEARTLATIAAVCGGPFLLADDLALLTAVEREVLEQPDLLDLAGRGGFRPVDLFDHVDESRADHVYAPTRDQASTWIATGRDRPAAALFNWTDSRAERVVPAGFAGARELWTGAAVTGPTITVPAHGVRVLLA